MGIKYTINPRDRILTLLGSLSIYLYLFGDGCLLLFSLVITKMFEYPLRFPYGRNKRKL